MKDLSIIQGCIHEHLCNAGSVTSVSIAELLDTQVVIVEDALCALAKKNLARSSYDIHTGYTWKAH